MYHTDAPISHGSPQGGVSSIENGIAIVGMSCRFAGARDIETYWHMLRNGLEGIERYSDEELIPAGVDPRLLSDPNYIRAGAPLVDMECFDAGLFGLSPRDAAIMDPQHRHFIECAWEALENAGQIPDQLTGAVGVFGGTGHNAYLFNNLLSNPKLVRDVGPFLLRHTSNDKDFLSTRVSYLLNLKGPSVNIQTACSTSLVAIHSAVQSLLNMECDMALAGAASIELPHRQGYLYEEGEITSADGHCRPFEANSTGAVFGSGVGVVVLRRLEDALEDNDHIYAVIRGSAVNNDGSGKVSYLSPSVDGHASVVSEALDISDVDARSIDYVEAHGTGTRVGDPIEIAALSQAYRRHTSDSGYCRIGSVKGNIGHTDTAAGVASVIKVALAMQGGFIPPTLHYLQPNPACDFPSSPFEVAGQLQPWSRNINRPRRAGVSSLGVGGTNAHIVMEEAPVRASGSASRPWQVLTISAQSASALAANAASLANHFEKHPETSLADSAYTLSTARKALPHRRTVVARNSAEVVAALRQPARDRKPAKSSAHNDEGTKVSFLFCGAGAQYAGMGAELYQTEPLFRSAIDECLAHLSQFESGTLKQWLHPDPSIALEAEEALQRPSIALPLLFSVQVALARVWMAWGIKPAAMIGHSSGEYAAAYLAGVLSLGDALNIVRTRGQLFETLPEGGMLSVPLSEAEVLALLPAELSIAAVNAPQLVVVSGPVPQIETLAAQLAEREVESQRVSISVAAHSAMLEPILEPFRQVLRSITFRQPTIPFVSNLTGDWITPAQATDPEYWVSHLRQPVRFTDGLARLLENNVETILLEVGPGRVMSSLARQHPNRSADQSIFNSMRHKAEQVDSDLAYLLNTLGDVWSSGATPDWSAYWGTERRLRIPLPSYQFDRQRHWFEPIKGIAKTDAEEFEADQPLPRKADLADWFYEPIWQRSPLQVAPIDLQVEAPSLIFEDDAGLGAALATNIRMRGGHAIIVRPGKRFRQLENGSFEINIRAAADYSTLIAALANQEVLPSRIYHMWLVTGSKKHDVLSLQDRGLFSLLFLTQALGELAGDAVSIAVVSDGVHRISDETGLMPAKATVLGPCHVIPREYPDIHVRNVDVRLPVKHSPAWVGLCDMLIAELSDKKEAELVSYRASERWTRGFAPAPRTEEPSAPPIFTDCRPKQKGVYLITGGLGGLGLEVAGHLAQTYSARLALMIRKPLPPRAQWQEIMARAGADPLAQKMRKIRAIEAAGGDVILVDAAVCNQRAVTRAIQDIKRTWGPIDGVFHTAGVIDDSLLEMKNRTSIERVLAPKLHGTLALQAALAKETPDFILLFSSISAFAGLPGQTDYAAANAFLDAYAQSRRDDATNVISVGWSRWQDVGMAADALPQSGDNRALGTLPLGEVLDHPFLDTLHRLSTSEIVVQTQLSPSDHWLLDEHRLADGSALIPGTGYLELVRAAFNTIEAGPSELSEILFLSPFAVADGEERQLRIHLNLTGHGHWSFSMQGRSDEGQAWTEHVRGSICHLVEPASAPVDLPHLKNAYSQSIDPTSLTDASSLMRFGPRWHSVQDLRVSESNALLELKLSPEFESDLENIDLHPALLDFATAGAQGLIPDREPGRDFFAPASYSIIKIYKPLPNHIISHIQYRPSAAGNVAVFDITIAAPDGSIIAKIDEFTMLRLANTAQLASTLSSSSTGTPPLRAVAKVGQNTESLVSSEGITVIERLLSGPRASHLIVAPTDLENTLKRMRAPFLPAVTIERNEETEVANPPITPAERIIADIWSEMLGIRAIQRSDDFFDLGGHSLLGVQFMNRLRKRTGKQLPLATLLETSTVEALAQLIAPEEAATLVNEAAIAANDTNASTQNADNRKIVTIRQGTGKTPLFMIHDGLGETLLYRSLAIRMDENRPVLGIEPDRYPGGTYLHTSIPEMASAYIERMQTVQPHGPYLVAGLCAGGVIAFEIAQQLQNKGEKTAFVGIIDAADVEARKKSFYVTRARLQRLKALVNGDTPGATPTLGTILQRGYNALSYEISHRIEWARRTRTVAQMTEHGDEEVVQSAADVANLSFLHLYEVAYQAHQPHGLFEGGEVVLFKATQGSGADDDVPYHELYTDCIFGWGKRVAGDVTSITVPGGHTSTLQEPHVDTLANAMADAIIRALPEEFTPPSQSPHQLFTPHTLTSQG